LTNAEYDDNRQFLDFFTGNHLGNSEFFNVFDNPPQPALPNFQGISSTFGRPDAIHYDGPMLQNSLLNVATGSSNYEISNNYYAQNGGLHEKEDRRHGMVPLNSGKLYSQAGSNYSSGNRLRGGHHSSLAEDQTTLGFGSDSNFANHHYAPPPGTTDLEEVEGRVLGTLKIFQPSNSVPNTQPPSPVRSKKKRPIEGGPSATHERSQIKKHKRSDNSEVKFEGSSSSEEIPRRKNGQRAKDTSDSLSTRRKSRTAESKRQNLTEAEKRENHIRSEQKRRNQIKEGFANLLALMPESLSEGSSNSKCIILSKAVDWLDSLVEGNTKLRHQLELLGGSVS
jgi:hypothetical protein